MYLIRASSCLELLVLRQEWEAGVREDPTRKGLEGEEGLG